MHSIGIIALLTSAMLEFYPYTDFQLFISSCDAFKYFFDFTLHISQANYY